MCTSTIKVFNAYFSTTVERCHDTLCNYILYLSWHPFPSIGRPYWLRHIYDNINSSLSTTACSDGPDGMLTRFTTFGSLPCSLPSFPNIGAAQAVAGWSSPACGPRWQISNEGKSIYFTAIDLPTTASCSHLKPWTLLQRNEHRTLA